MLTNPVSTLLEVWRKALQRLRLRSPRATRGGLPSQEGRTQSMDADEKDSVLWSLKLA